MLRKRRFHSGRIGHNDDNRSVESFGSGLYCHYPDEKLLKVTLKQHIKDESNSIGMNANCKTFAQANVNSRIEVEHKRLKLATKISNEDVFFFRQYLSNFFENKYLASIKKNMLKSEIGRNKEKKTKIVIKINQPIEDMPKSRGAFQLQELFDNLYEKRDSDIETFLFRELVSTTDYSWKFLTDWDVIYNYNYSVNDTSRPKKTVYGGGATGEFFSSVWEQMGQLKIKDGLLSKDDDMFLPLFDLQDVGYVPTSDYMIKNKAMLMAKKNTRAIHGYKEVYLETIERIKKYYRALGRIMLGAIRCGNFIVENVMPKFYFNIIFRNMQPLDPSYDLNHLLDDLFNNTNGRSSMKRFFSTVATTGKDAKQLLQEHFYDSKKIAIDSIREGINLGEKNHFTQILGKIPSEVVRASLFAKQDIHAEDLIQLLVPDYKQVKDNTMREKCNFFFDNILKVHIREKAEFFGGDQFLRQFLVFCTGSGYIPHKLTGFNIIVQFNSCENGLWWGRDSLPVSHTCERILKFPVPIYDSKESFAQKLDMALENSSHFFSFE